MNTIKNEIKKLSSEQVVLKNQRKTVNLVGERTMEPYDAYMKHQHNRVQLWKLHTAYQLLKGKEVFKPIKMEDSLWNHYLQNNIKNLVEQYSQSKAA